MALETRERASCVLPLRDGDDISVTTPGCNSNVRMLGVPLLSLPLSVYELVLDSCNHVSFKLVLVFVFMLLLS